MDTPLVSVIVPVYNIEDYIGICIESIRRQTYQNLQIILVDDGSTDQSSVICDAHASKDDRIEVIHQKNGGLVKARKRGLTAAKGTYIGFVDGDDYIEPQMYAALVREIDSGGADFVHSGYWKGDCEKIVPPAGIVNVSTEKNKFFAEAVLGPEKQIRPSIWSKLFRASLIRKCYTQVPDSCCFGEDTLTLFLCVLESDRIALTDVTYYHYRIREGSLAHKNQIRDLENVFHLHENLCKVLRVYGLYETCAVMIDEFLWGNLLWYMSRVSRHPFQIAMCEFADADRLAGKKIVLYGAGVIGRDYYAQLSRYGHCEVVAWVDAHPQKYRYPHVTLYGPEILSEKTFDLLVIAVREEKLAEEIRGQLMQSGVEESKICWEKPKELMLAETED